MIWANIFLIKLLKVSTRAPITFRMLSMVGEIKLKFQFDVQTDKLPEWSFKYYENWTW